MHFKTRSYWCFALLAQSRLRERSLQCNPSRRTPPAARAQTPTVRLFPEYILGPGDEIVITAVEAEEISNKPIRISATGDISLNTVGRIRAAGKTVGELEAELVDRLKPFIIRPDVTVAVTESRSQPVTVMGAVQSRVQSNLKVEKLFSRYWLWLAGRWRGEFDCQDLAGQRVRPATVAFGDYGERKYCRSQRNRSQLRGSIRRRTFKSFPTT